MDGVLADFDKGWVDRYNADFGTNIEYKHNDHWDALITLTGMTYEEWWDWARNKHEDLFLGLDPLPGAIEGVSTLKALGHDICIITAKPRWAAGHPSSWLVEHNIPYDEIHVTSKKAYVKCDVYVDDALHNVVDLMENANGLVIQYSAWPYVNRGKKSPAHVHCRSWDEIIDTVDAYKEWSRNGNVTSGMDIFVEDLGVNKWNDVSLASAALLAQEKTRRQKRSFLLGTRA